MVCTVDDEKILLRFATTSDAGDILRWRNDEVSRIASANTAVITEAEHVSWYNQALQNPQLSVLIAEKKPELEKVGMMRLDFDEKFVTAKISININPIFRGQGYGHLCLAKAKLFVLDMHKSCQKILADVRVDNIASQRIFSQAGYVVVSSTGDLLNLRLDLL